MPIKFCSEKNILCFFLRQAFCVCVFFVFFLSPFGFRNIFDSRNVFTASQQYLGKKKEDNLRTCEVLFFVLNYVHKPK